MMNAPRIPPAAASSRQDALAAQHELEQRLAEAETANRLKSDFLASISHEIRTPMMAILGFADLLLSRVRAEEDRQALLTIKGSGEHLLGLVNDLLDLAKIETGNLHVEQIPACVESLLAEVWQLLRARAEAKGLNFSFEHDPRVPESLLTDPHRLRQVLINLADNAIKFTERGNVRLASRWEQDSSRLIISVSDTGCGLTQSQQARIFAPYMQGSADTARRYGGTGLGLSISQRLVELLGGSIHVTSAPGVGSTFRCDLPLQPATAIHDTADATEHSHFQRERQEQCVPLARRNILLAEDGPDNRRLLQTLLQQAGAAVTVAENGHQAIEYVLERLPVSAAGNPRAPAPFDLILMDMQMPFIDGYQATRRIRELGYEGPVLAITAHAMQGVADQCLNAGCSSYMAKPVRRDQLLLEIMRLLRD